MVKIDIGQEGIFELLYPALVVLVTSIGKEKKPNVLTIAWSTPTSFDPPMVAISISPERYSYNLIDQTKEFAINIPDRTLMKQILICGTISGRDADKFKRSKLTPTRSRKIKPPIIKECIAHLECKTVDKIKTGDHFLIVGEVVAAYADEGSFDRKRYAIEHIQPLLHLQDGPHVFTVPSELISP